MTLSATTIYPGSFHIARQTMWPYPPQLLHKVHYGHYHPFHGYHISHHNYYKETKLNAHQIPSPWFCSFEIDKYHVAQKTSRTCVTTLCLKKFPTFILSVTSSNLNRFLHFLHCCIGTDNQKHQTQHYIHQKHKRKTEKKTAVANKTI